jgi:hypothetical protein
MEADPLDRPATWLGSPATTWHQTNFSKLVEVSFTPINTPLMVKVDTHTPHFGNSTCKALILSVVARHSLVERVVRL